MIRFPVDNLKVQGLQYQLSSIICHVGELSNGHYYNYCRDNKKWFKIDDEDVSSADDLENEVINKESYLLFYEEKT
jgi:ubiquitin C-terminal hydrolase